MWCKWNIPRLIVDRDMLYSTNAEMASAGSGGHCTELRGMILSFSHANWTLCYAIVWSMINTHMLWVISILSHFWSNISSISTGHSPRVFIFLSHSSFSNLFSQDFMWLGLDTNSHIYLLSIFENLPSSSLTILLLSKGAQSGLIYTALHPPL